MCALVLSIFTVLKEKYLCISKQGPNTQVSGCWWCFGKRDVGNISQGHRGVFCCCFLDFFCLLAFDFPQEVSYSPKIHMLFSLGLRRNWESKSSRWKMLHATSYFSGMPCPSDSPGRWPSICLYTPSAGELIIFLGNS